MPYFRRDLVPGDRVGLFWIYYYFLCPLLIGCTVHILSDANFLDPHALLATIKRVRLNALYVTPSLLESMMRNATTGDFQAAFQTVRSYGSLVNRSNERRWTSSVRWRRMPLFTTSTRPTRRVMSLSRSSGLVVSQSLSLRCWTASKRSSNRRMARPHRAARLASYGSTPRLSSRSIGEHAVVKHERGFFQLVTWFVN